MDSYRKQAIVVGGLFIAATVASIVGNVLFSYPIISAPDYLTMAAAHESQVLIGALFELIAAFAVANIAIWLYPVLRRHNEALALGSIGFRVFEGVLYALAAVALLSILTLSKEYVAAGIPEISAFQTSGTLLLALRDRAGEVGVIAFNLGALMYYGVFYQSRLIPRWLSVWGILAAAASLAAALLTMFGQVVPLTPASILMNIPIFLQEMVLAIWLIVKGFSSSAIGSGSAE